MPILALRTPQLPAVFVRLRSLTVVPLIFRVRFPGKGLSPSSHDLAGEKWHATATHDTADPPAATIDDS